MDEVNCLIRPLRGRWSELRAAKAIVDDLFERMDRIGIQCWIPGAGVGCWRGDSFKLAMEWPMASSVVPDDVYLSLTPDAPTFRSEWPAILAWIEAHNLRLVTDTGEPVTVRP